MRVPENSCGKGMCDSATAGRLDRQIAVITIEANRKDSLDLEPIRPKRPSNKATNSPTQPSAHFALRNPPVAWQSSSRNALTQARPARGFSTSTNADVRRTDQSQSIDQAIPGRNGDYPPLYTRNGDLWAQATKGVRSLSRRPSRSPSSSHLVPSADARPRVDRFPEGPARGKIYRFHP